MTSRFAADQKDALDAYPLSQEPGHDCRRDDPKYTSVSEWYRHHVGRVQVTMAWRLDQRIEATGEASPRRGRPL